MLIRKERIAGDVLLGVWRIEPQEGMTARESERHAVRSLLAELLQSEDYILEHNADGKPLLTFAQSPLQVSISHTKGYAAVLLSPTSVLGIDIERKSPRVKRVAERFLRDDELESLHSNTSVAEYLSFWCCKEALYKMFSEDHLGFHQMKISRLTSGKMMAENLLREISIEMHVEENEDYVMAFSCI